MCDLRWEHQGHKKIQNHFFLLILTQIYFFHRFLDIVEGRKRKKTSIWERHIWLVASRMCLCGLWPFGVPPSQSNTESLNPINQWLLVLTVAQNHLKNTESQAPLTVLKGSLGWGLSIGYFFFPRDPQVSSICCKHWEPQPWVFCFFPLASIYLPLTPRFFTVEIIDPFYFPSFRLKIS